MLDAVAKNPIVDGFTNPDDNGVNQYSEFGGKSQVYDDDGSLIDNGDQKLAFDFQNRLVEARKKSNNALIAGYIYTADGRRVLKVLAGSLAPEKTTRYLRLGWQIIEERNGADAIQRRYVKGRSMDEVIQMKDHTQAGQPVFYYHSNSQGFIGALTDASGAITEYYEYSQLGRRTILDSNKTTVLSASKVGNPIGFHGKWHDAETGLQYFEYRYYSPVTGRFISFDPLRWDGGASGNMYEAFGGDPWNRSDPWGFESFLDDQGSEAENQRRIDMATRILAKPDGVPPAVLKNAEDTINDADRLGLTQGLTSSMIWLGTMLDKGSITREEYKAGALALADEDASVRNEMRTQLMKSMRSKTPQPLKGFLDKYMPEKSCPPAGTGNPTKTNLKVNKWMKVAGVAGKGLAGVSVAVDIYDVASAPTNDEMYTKMAGAGGRTLGAIALGTEGAAYGMVGGPWGSALGGLIGAVIGGFSGGVVAEEAQKAIVR